MWHRLIRHESKRHTKEMREREWWDRGEMTFVANVAEMCILQIINKSKLIIKWKRKAGMRSSSFDTLFWNQQKKSHESEQQKRKWQISSCASAQREVWNCSHHTQSRSLLCFSFFLLHHHRFESFSFNLISSITLGRCSANEEEEKNCNMCRIGTNLKQKMLSKIG